MDSLTSQILHRAASLQNVVLPLQTQGDAVKGKMPERGGSSESLREGIEHTRPAKRKKQRLTPEDECVHTPWLASLGVQTSDDVRERLHYEIVAYSNYVTPTSQEDEARSNVVARIRAIVKHHYKDADVVIFGSTSTGLSLPDGDIDLVLRSEQIANLPSKSTLFRLAGYLKRSGLTRDPDVQVNHRARVPIVTFKTSSAYGAFDIDIGLNNEDGIQGIDKIKNYITSMPALRPLLLVLKGFLRQRKLNSAAHNGLGSYALSCMVISFLQINPAQRPQEFIDNPFDSKSLGTLLMDFFVYYGRDFPYETSYISVTQGKLLPKSEAAWIKTKLPEAIAVQCLIHPENDVGRPTSRIEDIRTTFNNASLTLLQHPTDIASVLGTIVAISQKTLDRRDQIRHLVDSAKSNPRTPQNTKINPQFKPPPHANRPVHCLPARPPSSNTSSVPQPSNTAVYGRFAPHPMVRDWTGTSVFNVQPAGGKFRLSKSPKPFKSPKPPKSPKSPALSPVLKSDDGPSPKRSKAKR